MTSWLKAGLIGIAIVVVLGLIGLIPVLGCITGPLTYVTYAVVGVLAASFMVPPREAGSAAGQGALAALVASFGGGIFNLIVSVIRMAMGGAAQGMQFLSQLPPELRHQLRDLGGEDLLFGAGSIGGAVLCGSACCLVGIVIAAALGAIGGAIYAAVRPS
jgi:hypothetical protein